MKNPPQKKSHDSDFQVTEEETGELEEMPEEQLEEARKAGDRNPSPKPFSLESEYRGLEQRLDGP